MTETDLTEVRLRLIELTKSLIMIPGTANRPDKLLDCMELACNHIEGIPGVKVDSYESGGYKSIVALPEGISKPDILLCGHIDVIEHGARDLYHGKTEGNRIVGPGAGDMKGSDSILLELFRLFHVQHPGVSLGLALTSDEEQGGEHGVRFLMEEKDLRCGIAIIPDGGSINQVIEQEKGIMHLKVHASGEAGHAARPWLCKNALEQLMEALQSLKNEFAQFQRDTHWVPTCAITQIATPNQTINRIPANASATLDVRFPLPHTIDTMRERIVAALGKNVELEEIVCAEPSHLSPDQRFLKIAESVTGKKTQLTHSSGGSDGRFFAWKGIPVILSRPVAGNYHAVNEWIDIDSMVEYYEICRRYIAERLI